MARTATAPGDLRLIDQRRIEPILAGQREAVEDAGWDARVQWFSLAR